MQRTYPSVSYSGGRGGGRGGRPRVGPPRNVTRRAAVPRRFKAFPIRNRFTGTLLQEIPVTGFPDKLTTRLRYSVFRNVTTAVGTGIDVYQYMINSTYDPDVTGGGHQPLYRDQLYAIYNLCVVTECKWMLHVTTSSTVGQLINVQATTYATTDNDVSTSIERGQTHRVVTQLGNPGYLSGTVDMTKLFGMVKKEDILTDDLFTHGSGSNPNKAAYLTLYTQDMTLTTSVLQYSLTFDMTVVFKEPVKIASS